MPVTDGSGHCGNAAAWQHQMDDVYEQMKLEDESFKDPIATDPEQQAGLGQFSSRSSDPRSQPHGNPPADNRHGTETVVVLVDDYGLLVRLHVPASMLGRILLQGLADEPVLNRELGLFPNEHRTSRACAGLPGAPLPCNAASYVPADLPLRSAEAGALPSIWQGCGPHLQASAARTCSGE